MYQSVINNIILVAGFAILIFRIARKGAFKYMPLKLKVSLIGFVVVTIGFDLNTFFCDERIGIEICSETLSYILGCMESIVFLAVDWLFASHYLKVACLFRLTFSSSHSIADLNKMQSRRKWLWILDVCVYVSLLLNFTRNK